MSDKNIYQRMALITAKLPVVAKNLFVETSSNKGYNAVSEADVLSAVKPLEAKYGVYSYPFEREIVSDEILENDTQYGKRTVFFSRIRTIYRFVNIDNPEEYVETTTYSEGIDSQDKGAGKAMTYGDKYALLKAYKISTGEDPDKDGSTEEHYETRQDNRTKCVECGKPISDKVARYCSENNMKPLCMDCQKKYKN